MKTRHIRTLMWIGSGVLLTGAVISAGAGLALPYQSPRTAQTITASDSSQASSQHNASLTLDAFEGLWAMNLRRPLVDPPPPEQLPQPVFSQAPTETPEGLALSVRLTGTAVENGHCYALVVGSDGKPTMKRVGDKVDNAEIVEINVESMTLRSGQQNITVKSETKRPEMPS